VRLIKWSICYWPIAEKEKKKGNSASCNSVNLVAYYFLRIFDTIGRILKTYVLANTKWNFYYNVVYICFLIRYICRILTKLLFYMNGLAVNSLKIYYISWLNKFSLLLAWEYVLVMNVNRFKFIHRRSYGFDSLHNHSMCRFINDSVESFSFVFSLVARNLTALMYKMFVVLTYQYSVFDKVLHIFICIMYWIISVHYDVIKLFV